MNVLTTTQSTLEEHKGDFVLILCALCDFP